MKVTDNHQRKENLTNAMPILSPCVRSHHTPAILTILTILTIPTIILITALFWDTKTQNPKSNLSSAHAKSLSPS
jgi:hypothetical protein